MVNFYVLMSPSVFNIQHHHFCARQVSVVYIDVHENYLACGAACGGPDYLDHIPWVLFTVRQELIHLCNCFVVYVLPLII